MFSLKGQGEADSVLTRRHALVTAPVKAAYFSSWASTTYTAKLSTEAKTAGLGAAIRSKDPARLSFLHSIQIDCREWYKSQTYERLIKRKKNGRAKKWYTLNRILFTLTLQFS